jgi:hypothetical protein
MDEELEEILEETNTEEQNNENTEEPTNILRNTIMPTVTPSIVKGDELMVFQGGSALGFATAHTFTYTNEEISIASKDHGEFGAIELGKGSWECTAECYYTDSDFSSLMTAATNKTAVTILFAKASNYATNGLTSTGGSVESWTAGAGWTGSAYITSLTANATSGEKATFSVTFKGKGAITATS